MPISQLGLDAILVGGCIRDALLGHTPTDVDIVLGKEFESGVAAITEALGEKVFSLGDRFQTLRMALFHGTLDITHLANPSWEQDLLRRDFTLNAIGLPFERFSDDDIAKALIDPTSGLGDLEHRRIVAISERNLLEDPLRILRAYRLSAQLGFEIEDVTATLLSLHAETIKPVSYTHLTLPTN